MNKLLALVSGLWLLASCGPATHIENSWRDPDVVVNTAVLKKFVVAALIKNQAERRNIEDRMAALYPGKAVPSYQEFGTSDLTASDEEYAKKLKDGNFDGIVIMRNVKVDKNERYVPGNYPPYYGRWRGYWRYSWNGFYDPGYYTVDKTYYVEVNVYSLIRDKLIWSGTTATFNPGNRESLYNGVAKTVIKKMKAEGFLQ